VLTTDFDANNEKLPRFNILIGSNRPVLGCTIHSEIKVLKHSSPTVCALSESFVMVSVATVPDETFSNLSLPWSVHVVKVAIIFVIYSS